MEDDLLAENEYRPFIINRTLSYFQDTVLYANEVNQREHLDSRLQYDFLLNSIRRKKRFSRCLKPRKDEDIDAIKEYYSCSHRKAYEIFKLLTGEQLSLIHKRLKRGGIQNGKQTRRRSRSSSS